MRYRIESIKATRWSVIDAANQCVFSGTYRQVEDWLDYQDNAQGQPELIAAPRLAADSGRSEPVRRRQKAQ